MSILSVLVMYVCIQMPQMQGQGQGFMPQQQMGFQGGGGGVSPMGGSGAGMGMGGVFGASMGMSRLTFTSYPYISNVIIDGVGRDRWYRKRNRRGN